jgi:hypothetical protein
MMISYGADKAAFRLMPPIADDVEYDDRYRQEEKHNNKSIIDRKSFTASLTSYDIFQISSVEITVIDRRQDLLFRTKIPTANITQRHRGLPCMSASIISE